MLVNRVCFSGISSLEVGWIPFAKGFLLFLQVHFYAGFLDSLVCMIRFLLMHSMSSVSCVKIEGLFCLLPFVWRMLQVAFVYLCMSWFVLICFCLSPGVVLLILVFICVLYNLTEGFVPFVMLRKGQSIHVLSFSTRQMKSVLPSTRTPKDTNSIKLIH